ncbi:unnamed protein product [Chondrus crispus]|uniref:Uncharacterized protein n=1 Tax=Chondrus crispus TaxID=2769 RepID=R7QAE1_CHOCR|nr:unnamed protein product [Chondrus crispus]CDF34435.1 unnamed protein product [Chondrus crispus]|eukprot:XP_005714254.1 unnamed protein product [Chondrus crispus]
MLITQPNEHTTPQTKQECTSRLSTVVLFDRSASWELVKAYTDMATCTSAASIVATVLLPRNPL